MFIRYTPNARVWSPFTRPLTKPSMFFGGQFDNKRMMVRLVTQRLAKRRSQSSKVLDTSKVPSVQFFLHRSRIQRLYRRFLQVCHTGEERAMVREAFKQNTHPLSQAEAILKTLQAARNRNKSAEEGDKQEPLWPWQKRPCE